MADVIELFPTPTRKALLAAAADPRGLVVEYGDGDSYSNEPNGGGGRKVTVTVRELAAAGWLTLERPRADGEGQGIPWRPTLLGRAVILPSAAPTGHRWARDILILAEREVTARVADRIAGLIEAAAEEVGRPGAAVVYDYAVFLARSCRVPDCGDQYHGADGGPCGGCGFDAATVVNPAPATPR